MTKKQEENGTADQILRSAARQFRQNGIGNTTLRGIAKDAGVLLGTVHYWFPSKEAILLALTERAAGRVQNAINDAIADEADPSRRLWLAFRAYLNVLISDTAITTVLLYEYRPREGREWQTVNRLREEFDRLWDGLIHQAVGAGGIRPGLNLNMVRQFGLGAINWLPQWYSEDGDLTVDEIARQFADFFARGVFVQDRVDDWILETSSKASVVNKIGE